MLSSPTASSAVDPGLGSAATNALHFPSEAPSEVRVVPREVTARLDLVFPGVRERLRLSCRGSDANWFGPPSRFSLFGVGDSSCWNLRCWRGRCCFGRRALCRSACQLTAGAGGHVPLGGRRCWCAPSFPECSRRPVRNGSQIFQRFCFQFRRALSHGHWSSCAVVPCCWLSP